MLENQTKNNHWNTFFFFQHCTRDGGIEVTFRTVLSMIAASRKNSFLPKTMTANINKDGIGRGTVFPRIIAALWLIAYPRVIAPGLLFQEIWYVCLSCNYSTLLDYTTLNPCYQIILCGPLLISLFFGCKFRHRFPRRVYSRGFLWGFPYMKHCSLV